MTSCCRHAVSCGKTVQPHSSRNLETSCCQTNNNVLNTKNRYNQIQNFHFRKACAIAQLKLELQARFAAYSNFYNLQQGQGNKSGFHLIIGQSIYYGNDK